MAEPKTPDEYLAQLPEEQRAPMAQIRAAIRAVAPDADEVLSYRMPAFKSDGRILIYYAAFRDHYSLYPFTPAVVEALGEQIEPYLRSKGTIWFDARKRIPVGLIKKIVKVRLRENADAARRRKR
jgi:uncharacterized protein YdhG (YjbR/CyaY superfamily)